MPDNGAPDFSHAFRGLGDLEQLVRHVLATRPNNETDWLEWKVGVDLGTPAGRFSVSKHVLGFGNRHPDRAETNAGGCSYVVLGAQPGELVGQPPIDPADVEAGLGRYIGQDGPAWTPIWVSVDGTDVLTILIEPPIWGDRIHTLKKGYDNFHPGQVFVRRPGATHVASPAEMETLERRLLHRPAEPLRIEVLVTGDPPAPLDISDDAVQEWLSGERTRLLDPLLVYEEEQRKKASQMEGISLERLALDDLKQEAEVGAAAAAKAQMMRQVAASVAGLSTTEREKRTPDEYRELVENYLAQCRPLVAQAVLAEMVDDDRALLELAIRNPSDRNLPSVKLEVEFHGLVLSFEDQCRDDEGHRQHSHQQRGNGGHDHADHWKFGPLAYKVGTIEEVESSVALRAPPRHPPAYPPSTHLPRAACRVHHRLGRHGPSRLLISDHWDSAPRPRRQATSAPMMGARADVARNGPLCAAVTERGTGVLPTVDRSQGSGKDNLAF